MPVRLVPHARAPHWRGAARQIKWRMVEPLNPHHLDPADPHYLQSTEEPVLERIAIATEGEDCDQCVRKLREPLMRIPGVCDVRVNTKRERVIVTFDARKTHPPDLHDAILRSGYKPSPVADD